MQLQWRSELRHLWWDALAMARLAGSVVRAARGIASPGASSAKDRIREHAHRLPRAGFRRLLPRRGWSQAEAARRITPIGRAREGHAGCQQE